MLATVKWPGIRTFFPEFETEITVVDGPSGIGQCRCPECEGTGWWAYGEPEIEGAECVNCKGTGKRYVMICPGIYQDNELISQQAS